MAVLNQDRGRVMTTRGYKHRDFRQCAQCGEDKSDALFTMNANGQFVCPDCAGSKHDQVLRQSEPDAPSGA